MVTGKEKKAKRPRPESIKELGAEVEKMTPKSIQALLNQTQSRKGGSYLAVIDHLKNSMRGPLDRTYRTGKDSGSVVSESVGQLGSGSVGQ
jgi:hypothetical protein